MIATIPQWARTPDLPRLREELRLRFGFDHGRTDELLAEVLSNWTDFESRYRADVLFQEILDRFERAAELAVPPKPEPPLLRFGKYRKARRVAV